MRCCLEFEIWYFGFPPEAPLFRVSIFGFRISAFMGRPRYRLWLVMATALMLWGTTACSSIGPSTVARDRFDYVSAISDSWKQQMLLNIVKMRYGDNPVFMDIGQVISGYELEGTLSASGTVSAGAKGPNFPGDLVNLGASGRYVDRPTITYAPLTGADFVKTMLTPFPPGAVMFLIEAGWPVDFMLRISVHAINGIRNQKAGIETSVADPEFIEILKVMKRVQSEGGIGFRVQREQEGSEATLLLFHTRHLNPEGLQDIAELKRLLRLNPDAMDIRITYGADAQSDNEIALHTRSAYHVLVALSSLVSVPSQHVAEHRTVATMDEVPGAPPLLTIHSGTEQPADAFVQAKYRGHWYWVDDRDFRSKRTMTFLTILFTLSETGQKIQQPILTIRAN